MDKIKDFFQLAGLRVYVFFWDVAEYCRVVFRYYRNPRFAKDDLALLLRYLLYSPFQISKHFLQGRGAGDLYTYGETPLTTMDMIAKWSEISTDDVVYELGCGRGRTCIWLHHFIGCRVVGVDYVPDYIRNAREVSKLDFREEDMLDVDLSDATMIYLFENSLNDAFIQKLCKRLPEGVKIVTVSYPLTDYDKKNFSVLKVCEGRFNWGKTEVYLQKKSATR
ncbi:MAG: class I SAM-dependent methyltransferase [Chlamydiales bacterium]|nr:class I SAM-dependent methyltransferase [Chlamydiia bacterium]MCP5507662.1 class I SAM-dependent methyltransferase [Chlamydiales bacterium]